MHTPGGSLFYKILCLSISFILLLVSQQPALGADSFLSSALDGALANSTLIFFFAGVLVLFMELFKASAFKQQLSSLLLFVFIFMFLFFFTFFFYNN